MQTEREEREERERLRLRRLGKKWTVIATRARSCGPMRSLTWQPKPAPIKLETALKYSKPQYRFLVVANRHFPDRVELLVRPTERVFED